MKDMTINEVTMSSLEIAQLTGKQHKHVLRDIDNLLKELEIDSAQIWAEYKDSSGKPNRSANLNRELTDCLLTGYSAKLRMAVIKRWQELEKSVATKPQLPDFTNPIIAARAWADEVEAKLQLEHKVIRDAPKVEFYDDIGEAEGLLTMAEVAKTLNRGIGRNKLYEFLRWLGVLRSNNEPYQQYVQQGKFVIKTGLRNGHQWSQTYVTGKGVQSIHKAVTAKLELFNSRV